MPLVESAMCGRAVVCSDLPIHRVVAPPWVRFVSSDIPADALWSQIRLASRPSRPARDAYSRRYGWSSVATRLLSLLERDE